MAFSLPAMPAPSGPLLFQSGLSLAARRAQLKTGNKPKKPSLALTIDLSSLPAKPSENRFPPPKGPPVLPSAAELDEMTPGERLTAENTVFNWSLGKKKFDAAGREIASQEDGHESASTDQDDNESVVSLVHSSNAPSAASSTISTPSTGKSVLENGNFESRLSRECDDDSNDGDVVHNITASAAANQTVRIGSVHPTIDLATDCGSYQVKTGTAGRRRTRSESDRSVRWAKSRRTVAFVCASSQHVYPSGEGAGGCKCVDCGVSSPSL